MVPGRVVSKEGRDRVKSEESIGVPAGVRGEELVTVVRLSVSVMLFQVVVVQSKT